MKKIYWILFVMFFSISAVAEDKPNLRLITVTGSAEVRVVPDEVVLTLGVEIGDKELQTAKNKNDQIAKKIINLGKKYKIDGSHIQTDFISIQPRYKDTWEHRNFLGYFVRKTIVFTLRDISRFENLLTDALEAGANYVHGIEFRTTKLRKYRDQARALAIKAAREKAEDLAKELGCQVGKPHSIQEEQSGWWSWYNYWWGGRWRSSMMQNVIQEAGSTIPTDAGESTIAPGQINVRAKVAVSFELK